MTGARADAASTDGGGALSIDADAPGGVVEVVDPVENEEFCANCGRVRVTPEGQFKGCLNRGDDHRSTGAMTREEIRAAFEETVANRVPYYGEYLVDEDGEWVLAHEYR